MAEEIEININTNINGSENIEALKNKLDDVKESADTVSNSLSDEAGTIEQNTQATEQNTQAKEQNSQAKDNNTSSTEQNSQAKDNNTQSTDNETQSTEKNTESKNQNTQSTEQNSQATEALTNIISGLVSIGLADYFTSSAQAFDNYTLSMSAMSTVASNNNVSLSSMTNGVKAVTDATSISGGVAREFFNNMVNMGVTNTKALSDTMIGLQGSTVITGSSFDSMKGKLIMMMNSTSLQSRALTGMGLSMQKLAQVNGMSVDELKSKWESFTPDQKLAILNKGLSENKGLTEQLAQTSGDKLKEIENSWGALSIAIGQSTSGATNAVYDLTNNGIQGLTWAIKNVPFMDTFAGIGLGAGSALMSISPLIMTFNQLSMAINNARKVTDLLTLSNIRETASNIAGKIANTTRIAIDTMRAGAQWLINDSLIAGAFAEYTFLAPLLLIIGAVAGLIAGIYLLGQYMGWWNDWGGFINVVKIRIMQLWNAFVRFCQLVYIGIQKIISSWNNFKAKVHAVMNNIRTGIINKWNNIKSRVINFVRNIINGVVNGFRNLVSKAKSILSRIYNAITSPFKRAYDKVVGIIDDIKSTIHSIPIIGGVTDALGLTAGFDMSGGVGGTFTTGESLSSMVKNSSNSNLVVNINGIVENDAKEYIVNAVVDKVNKERLITGTF